MNDDPFSDYRLIDTVESPTKQQCEDTSVQASLPGTYRSQVEDSTIIKIPNVQTQKRLDELDFDYKSPVTSPPNEKVVKMSLNIKSKPK